MNNELLDITQLSEIIRMNEQTIRNKISKASPLPPSFKLPDSRIRLWRRSDVDAWINQVADEFIKKEEYSREKFQELTSIKHLRKKKVKQHLS